MTKSRGMDRREFLRVTGGLTLGAAIVTSDGCGGGEDSAAQDAGAARDGAVVDDTGGPVAPAFLFHSDWRSGTGSADAVVRDTAQTKPWEILIGGVGVLSVIDAAGLDFPSSSCLQVDCIYSGDTVQEFDTGEVSLLPGGGAWAIPAIGESLYYRLYKRLVYPHATAEPPPAGNNNHCVEERSGGATNWSWTFRTTAAGWTPCFNVWSAGVPTRFLLGGATPIALSRDATYRIEWALHRTGDMSRTHEVRIYDAADTLLYATADFQVEEANGARLDQHTAVLNHLELDAFQLGTNGMGFNPPNEPTMNVTPAWYFAAVAVATGAWCGPYANGI